MCIFQWLVLTVSTALIFLVINYLTIKKCKCSSKGGNKCKL
jgi:hypothetical protein